MTNSSPSAMQTPEFVVQTEVDRAALIDRSADQFGAGLRATRRGIFLDGPRSLFPD